MFVRVIRAYEQGDNYFNSFYKRAFEWDFGMLIILLKQSLKYINFNAFASTRFLYSILNL